MNFLIRYITLIVFLMTCACVFGQDGVDEDIEPSIIVRAYCDKQTIYIGDNVEFTVEIEHEKNISVEPIRPPAELGQFEIKDAKLYPDSRLPNGKTLRKLTYTLSTYVSGEYEIPSMTVQYTDSNGNEQQTQSQPIQIVVKSVSALGADRDDIRDVKSPVMVPVDNTVRNLTIASAIALLVLIVVGIVYYRHWKRLKESQAKGPLEPSRPIEEIALEELERIAGSGLLENGLVKQYYTDITEALRTYLGRRYRFDAIDMTTSELLFILGDYGIESFVYSMIEGFLIEGDLVKFAKYIPPREECETFIDSARRIVEITPAPTEIAPPRENSSEYQSTAAPEVGDEVASSVQSNPTSASQNLEDLPGEEGDR